MSLARGRPQSYLLPTVSSSHVQSVSFAASTHVAFNPTEHQPLQKSEESWFREEVLPHESSLRSYLKIRFPLDPNDLIQDAYVKILKMRRNTPVEFPKSLLFTLARNAAISIIR